MYVPCHDAETLCHANAVGIEGVKFEMVVAGYEERNQKSEGNKEFFEEASHKTPYFCKMYGLFAEDEFVSGGVDILF